MEIDIGALATEAVRFTGMVGIGTAALKWLVKRYDRQTTEIRALATQAHDECVKRENAILKRLQNVEDEQRGESRTLLLRSASALEMNGRAFKALAESPSGMHPAISADPASPGPSP